MISQSIRHRNHKGMIFLFFFFMFHCAGIQIPPKVFQSSICPWEFPTLPTWGLGASLFETTFSYVYLPYKLPTSATCQMFILLKTHGMQVLVLSLMSGQTPIIPKLEFWRHFGCIPLVNPPFWGDQPTLWSLFFLPPQINRPSHPSSGSSRTWSPSRLTSVSLVFVKKSLPKTERIWGKWVRNVTWNPFCWTNQWKIFSGFGWVFFTLLHCFFKKKNGVRKGLIRNQCSRDFGGWNPLRLKPPPFHESWQSQPPPTLTLFQPIFQKKMMCFVASP